MSVSEFQVQAGEIIAHRLFEVSYSIDLTKVESLWAERNGGRTSRSQLQHTPAKAVKFDVPPVELDLDPVWIELDCRKVEAAMTARLYDFGVVALALRWPVQSVSWADFVMLVNAMDKVAGLEAQIDIWGESLKKVCQPLTSAIVRPTLPSLAEDYLLAVVREWGRPLKAEEIMEGLDLVPLLSGEQRSLSEGARRDLLRQQFSYYEDDLVVLTWDRAFIYEPRGDSDVCDILEVANAQLLEFRYYDELLDDELPRMYDLVEETRRRVSLLSARRFAHLARRLYTLVAEVTELTERVDNALHVTEDVYLARVYTSALETFRVPIVSGAVDRKLSIVRETYTALFDEAHGARGELLEIAVVLLIVIEIVLAILHHG